MTLHYINSFAAGTQHSEFNRATLAMLAEVWPGDVCVSSVKTSVAPLKSIGNTAKIKSWKTLWVNSGNSAAALALRYLQSAVNNVWQLIKAGKDDLVVYNFNNPFSTGIIDAVCRLVNRNVIIFCHNEMEYIVNSGKHRALQKRVLATLVKRYFSPGRRSVAKGLNFIVLGDSILKNLKPLVSPALYERFSSIDHPLLPISELPHVAAHETTNIGVVGIVNYYKGASEIVEIARLLSDVNNLKICIVGSVQGDTELFIKAGIQLPLHPEKPMSTADFERAISQLDFVLLLYPTDTYRLIASGAVLEALRFRKPIIAYRTDYFDYLFKKFGPFGYLADSRAEIEQLLRNAATLSRDFHYDRIASQLSPQSLKPSLECCINRCYPIYK
ncbi:MAG: glycosyltransferase [Muribaculum sp.]|nr:glycosyltransferase [Muribaculaceae bacterium]MCM1081717.1 glycosyltransferase [Muribaculum sp.]